MGKPFDVELEILPQTYSWALSYDVGCISSWLQSSAHLPLLAVGSGGSLSAAEVMVASHQRHARGLARAVTPLELQSAMPANGNASICFFSAGGGNIDIRRAFEHALLSESKSVTAFVGREESPLAEISKRYRYSNLFEIALPSGSDGFLATNSLLAFAVLICRAYDHIFPLSGVPALPATIDSLFAATLPQGISLSQLEKETENIWNRSTIHLLYSADLKPAAVDIESKFIEAGLSSVHLADFRNFAHGRHHWLDKHPSTTAILALSMPQDRTLAEATFDLIPAAFPRVHIPLNGEGSAATISGLLLALFFTSFAGKVCGIDPGRPGVPEYGGKIYNLDAPSGFLTHINNSDAAIKRKIGISPVFVDDKRRDAWSRSYEEFKSKLARAGFRAVVMDYDGTVVDSRHRFKPPEEGITSQLVRLLSAGIIIGFATGRGKSIRRDLQKVIPKDFWENVIIGYYNGAEVSALSDDTAPDSISAPCSELQTLLHPLSSCVEISSLAKIEARKFQLTLEPKDTSKDIIPETLIYELAQDQLGSAYSGAVTIFRSSHSIDILAQGVSKLSVLQEIQKRLDEEGDILTVGDRGKWPGNDSMLLKHLYSLSVDEVSPCEATCWNLCPAGVRGPQGTLFYLRSLRVVEGAGPVAIFTFGEDSES